MSERVGQPFTSMSPFEVADDVSGEPGTVAEESPKSGTVFSKAGGDPNADSFSAMVISADVPLKDEVPAGYPRVDVQTPHRPSQRILASMSEWTPNSFSPTAATPGNSENAASKADTPQPGGGTSGGAPTRGAVQPRQAQQSRRESPTPSGEAQPSQPQAARRNPRARRKRPDKMKTVQKKFQQKLQKLLGGLLQSLMDLFSRKGTKQQ